MEDKYEEMANILLAIPKCRCGAVGKESHTCPLATEIHHDETKCNCCKECEIICSDEI